MLKLFMPLVLALLLSPAGSTLASDAEPHLVHVVLLWLNEPGNEDHRAQIIAATRGFASIPGVKGISVGEPVSSQRSVVDDSFDIGLYISFSSKQALEAYLVHPKHKAAQQSVLGARVKRAVIYDFWDAGT
jgi:hypothetical protein